MKENFVVVYGQFAKNPKIAKNFICQCFWFTVISYCISSLTSSIVNIVSINKNCIINYLVLLELFCCWKNIYSAILLY